MDPQNPAYNVDWVFSNNSNVHVANHRDWFTSFTAFSTTVGASVFDISSMGVEGIGEVTLCTTTDSTPEHQTIVLHEVLYAPGSICNIIGGTIARDYEILLTFRSDYSRILHPQTGACYGLLDNCKLQRLRLWGYRPDQTSLDINKTHIIRATWSSGERALWETFKQQQKMRASMTDSNAKTGGNMGSSATKPSLSPPLTQSERKWLKEHWDGEFKFLRSYNLSIYEEEDRDEGRRIMRAFMAADEDGGEY